MACGFCHWPLFAGEGFSFSRCPGYLLVCDVGVWCRYLRTFPMTFSCGVFKLGARLQYHLFRILQGPRQYKPEARKWKLEVYKVCNVWNHLCLPLQAQKQEARSQRLGASCQKSEAGLLVAVQSLRTFENLISTPKPQFGGHRGPFRHSLNPCL